MEKIRLQTGSCSNIVAEKVWLDLEFLGFGREWQAVLRGGCELATCGFCCQVFRRMQVVSPA